MSRYANSPAIAPAGHARPRGLNARSRRALRPDDEPGSNAASEPVGPASDAGLPTRALFAGGARLAVVASFRVAESAIDAPNANRPCRPAAPFFSQSDVSDLTHRRCSAAT